jgi:exopolysaccharide biosynthesis polyprenyl glycosylphosphotransferase
MPMQTALRPRTLVLFVGDLVFFTLSLWLSLYLRVFEVPSRMLFAEHMVPFSLLFVAWVFVFFIAGLYESRLIIFARRALSATLLTAQVINMILAALFFFFIPLFGIAPKTLLIIYLFVSFVLVLFWRAALFPWLGLAKPEAAVLVGEGSEIEELGRALAGAPRAPLRIAEVISPAEPDLSRAVVAAMERQRARVVIADFDNPAVAAAFPQMYNLLSVGVRFIDALTLYEELFGRVPLSRLNTAWLARNINSSARMFYDVFKRFMDIVIAFPAGLLSLIFYPFVIAAIKLEDGGAVFIAQKRVGLNDRVMYIHKFRSMQRNDMELTTRASDNKITKVGAFIRKTRIDELPQLWDIVRGELSFVGPRPELPSGVALYEKEIPYYGLRHLVKPGLSGWAQLYHHADAHHAADVVETRNKLSFDLFYLKHRSLWLDAVIALKTIRRVLMRGNA